MSSSENVRASSTGASHARRRGPGTRGTRHRTRRPLDVEFEMAPIDMGVPMIGSWWPGKRTDQDYSDMPLGPADLLPDDGGDDSDEMEDVAEVTLLRSAEDGVEAGGVIHAGRVVILEDWAPKGDGVVNADSADGDSYIKMIDVTPSTRKRRKKQNGPGRLPGFVQLFLTVELATMNLLGNAREMLISSALPLIVDDPAFEKDERWISWVLSAFPLTGAVMSPIATKLGTKYGKKKLLLLSMLIYLVAGLVSGLSVNMGMLVATRVIQGCGTGMFALSYAVIRDNVARRIMAHAMSIITAMFSLGTIFGLIFGGLLLQWLHWKLCITIAMLPMLGLFMTLQCTLPESRKSVREKQPLDVVGCMLCGALSASVMLAFTFGDMDGFQSPACLCFIHAAAVLLPLFVGWEIKGTSHPLVPMQILLGRRMLGANIIAVLIAAVTFGNYRVFPFFYSAPTELGGLGIDNPLAYSSILAVSGVTSFLFSFVMGPLVRLFGSANVLCLHLLLYGSSYIFCVVFHSYVWQAIIVQALFGVSLAGVQVGLTMVVADSTSFTEYAMASAVCATLRIVGRALGPVFCGTVMDANSQDWKNDDGSMVSRTTEDGFVIVWLILAGLCYLGAFACVICRGFLRFPFLIWGWRRVMVLLGLTSPAKKRKKDGKTGPTAGERSKTRISEVEMRTVTPIEDESAYRKIEEESGGPRDVLGRSATSIVDGGGDPGGGPRRMSGEVPKIPEDPRTQSQGLPLDPGEWSE